MGDGELHVVLNSVYILIAIFVASNTYIYCVKRSMIYSFSGDLSHLLQSA
jgi:hypothetical protein